MITDSDTFHQYSRIHNQFLKNRLDALRQLETLIRLQFITAGYLPLGKVMAPESRRDSLFNQKDLEEFATGSVSKCFGPEFAIYEGRRFPRIPSGDLLLMSRVLSISGTQHKLEQSAEIVTEYDVPSDTWFFRDQGLPLLPESIYMEMGLQPCGFLSAYLGSTFLFLNMDFYFRNLDGQACVLASLDLRQQTVTCRARLKSTLVSGNTIIQKFSFGLYLLGKEFFKGESTFGYFSSDSLTAQTGLDGGKETSPELEKSDGKTESVDKSGLLHANFYKKFIQPDPQKPFFHLPTGQLLLIDKFLIAPDEGQYGYGLVLCKKTISPSDWYFKYHFFQDPVMPGSLGVEAVYQALQAFAIHMDLGSEFITPYFEPLMNQNLEWKYRGQVLPTQKEVKIEVHIRQIDRNNQVIKLSADASIWADNIRIYEIKQAGICIRERATRT